MNTHPTLNDLRQQDRRLRNLGFARVDSTRGVQVKQLIRCLKHNETFEHYPISVNENRGCDKCKLELALTGAAVPGFVYTEEIVRALLRKFPKHTHHRLLKYGGSKTLRKSIFRCEKSGEKFKSSIEAELSIRFSKTGCKTCSEQALTAKRAKLSLSNLRQFIKRLEKEKPANLGIDGHVAVCKIHGPLDGYERSKLFCKRCGNPEYKPQPQVRAEHQRALKKVVKSLPKNLQVSKDGTRYRCKIHPNVTGIIHKKRKRKQLCAECRQDDTVKRKVKDRFPTVEVEQVERTQTGVWLHLSSGEKGFLRKGAGFITYRDRMQFPRYTTLEKMNMLSKEKKEYFREQINERFERKVKVRFNVNPSNKYEILCKHVCGHEWTTLIGNLRASVVGCPVCGRRQAGDKTKLPMSVVMKRVARNPKLEYVERKGSLHVLRCKICSNTKAFNLHGPNTVPRCGICDSSRVGSKSWIAEAWLSEIEELYKVKLQGGVNDKEKAIRIEDTTYRVDGYEKKTKTIFEFFGDYYHGNPNTGVRDPHKFKKTMARIIKFNLRGYNVCFVWETDYKAGRIFSGVLHGKIPTFV